VSAAGDPSGSPTSAQAVGDVAPGRPVASRRTVVQADGRAKAYRPLPQAERTAAIDAGLSAYVRGDFFEAHELLEPAWMGTDDVAERALLQGLIKVAAADVHGVRENPRGVARNLEGALDRLREAATAERTLPGLDLDAFITAVEARLVHARAGEATAPIPLSWSAA
jgi:predicted metal-dependent hydrolase